VLSAGTDGDDVAKVQTFWVERVLRSALHDLATELPLRSVAPSVDATMGREGDDVIIADRDLDNGNPFEVLDRDRLELVLRRVGFASKAENAVRSLCATSAGTLVEVTSVRTRNDPLALTAPTSLTYTLMESPAATRTVLPRMSLSTWVGVCSRASLSSPGPYVMRPRAALSLRPHERTCPRIFAFGL
jgi:hypothetical protein